MSGANHPTPENHTHTDECWEPDSGCDMGRNEKHAVADPRATIAGEDSAPLIPESSRPEGLLASKQSLYEEALALLARADALLDGMRTRHEARLIELLAEIDLRFTSGNSVPVERAAIRASEWAAIRQYISASLGNRQPDETSERCHFRAFGSLPCEKPKGHNGDHTFRLPEKTSERSSPGLLRRLDALVDLPVGVTAIADEAIFRDAATEIRSLEKRLEAANARIQRWQMPECIDPGWEMRDGQMVCKGCNRSFGDVFNCAEAASESPEKAEAGPTREDFLGGTAVYCPRCKGYHYIGQQCPPSQNG